MANLCPFQSWRKKYLFMPILAKFQQNIQHFKLEILEFISYNLVFNLYLAFFPNWKFGFFQTADGQICHFLFFWGPGNPALTQLRYFGSGQIQKERKITPCSMEIIFNWISWLFSTYLCNILLINVKKFDKTS